VARLDSRLRIGYTENTINGKKEKLDPTCEVKMIEDQLPFGYNVPFPNNPISRRLISIYGSLPPLEYPTYKEFDSFLWYLMDLEKNRPGDPITLVLDNQGGDVRALETLLDRIHLISSPVHMVAGNAYSGAALLFASGEKGHRYVFEHSQIIFHQAKNDYECPHCAEEDEEHVCEECPHCAEESEGPACEELTPTASDESLRKINWRLASLLYKCTDGKILDLSGDWSDVSDEEERIRGVLSLLEKDLLLNAEEAIKYGVADHIIDKEKLWSLFLR